MFIASRHLKQLLMNSLIIQLDWSMSVAIRDWAPLQIKRKQFGEKPLETD